MKHFYTIKQCFLVFALLLSTLAASAADSFVIGDFKYTVKTTNEKEVSVSAAKTTISGDVKIPESVEYEGVEYTVTSIASSGFSRSYDMTSVYIPNSVTEISSSAFMDCNGMTSIRLSENLTVIKARGIGRCYKLAAIEIPNSVTTIEEEAFISCSALTEMIIPNSVESIGRSAFSGCTKLTSIQLPNSLTTISNGLVSDCPNLISIKIPNSVTSIENSAFSKCKNLLSVTIPNSVTTIGNSVFSGCKNLLSVTIPSSVTSMGYSVFRDCSSLPLIYIPASVAKIGYGMFDGCTKLYEAGDEKGIYCEAKEKPEEWKETWNEYETEDGDIYLKPLWGAQPLEYLKYTILKDKDNEVAVSAANMGMAFGEIVIPETVEIEGVKYTVSAISDNAFFNCEYLVSLDIPNTITTIGDNVFSGCDNLIYNEYDMQNIWEMKKIHILYL